MSGSSTLLVAEEDDAVASAATAALLKRMASAWSRGDARAYAACFTLSATHIAMSGDAAVGRAEIEAGHARAFATSHRRSALERQAVERAVLVPGAAPRRALATVVRDVVRAASGTGSAERRNSYRITLALVEGIGGEPWLVEHFQSTRVAAAGGGGGESGPAGLPWARIARAAALAAALSALAAAYRHYDYRAFTKGALCAVVAAQLVTLLS